MTAQLAPFIALLERMAATMERNSDTVMRQAELQQRLIDHIANSKLGQAH